MAANQKTKKNNTAMEANKVSMKIIKISMKVILAAVIIMVLYKGTTMAYSYGYAIFNDVPMEEAPGTDISVTIDKNTSAREIGNILESQGLVDNGFIFYIQTKMIEKGSEIKPGRYELNTSMTAEEMINVMAAKEEAEEKGEEEGAE